MAKRILPLSKIRLDGNTQPRVELDEFLITEYREAYAREAEMPPLQVMFDGVSYWLWDGFHRRWAAERAGLEKLPCIITEGTQQDAQWASYSANIAHGLRRSNPDKAKAVKAAVRHPNAAKMSDRKLAQYVCVDDKTVAKYRAELESTAEIPQSPTRTGRDGRTINTANIGKRHEPQIETPMPSPVGVLDDDDYTETTYDSPDYDDLPDGEESEDSHERTIADDLRDAVFSVRCNWPGTPNAVVAAILENMATQIRLD